MEDTTPTIEETMGAVFDAVADEPETEATEAIADGPARDEHGRFVAGEIDSDVEVDDEPTAAIEAAEDDAPDEGQEQLHDAAIHAPQSWSEADREVFSALPPEVQEIIAERESQRDKGFQEKAQELARIARQYEPIEPVLAQRRATFEAQGVSEAEGLNGLFKVSDFAAERPEEFIQWFAQQRGVDLGQFAQPSEALDDGDPYMAEIRRMQVEHKRELDQIRQEQNGQQEAQIRAANQARIEAFQTETDQSGRPAHPYFDEVKEHMARLIQAGLAVDLPDAYEQACRLHPDVSEAHAQMTHEEREAQRLTEQKRASARAKRAIGKLKSTGSGRRLTPAAAATPLETMARVFDENNAA